MSEFLHSILYSPESGYAAIRCIILAAANRELQARGKDIETLTNALNYARADLGLNPKVTLDGAK